MRDEHGADEKIIAVPVDKLHPFYKRVKSYRDLPEILIEQIGHFFEHYKDLEKGKWVKLARWVDRAGAEAFIRSGITRAADGTAKHKAAKHKAEPPRRARRQTTAQNGRKRTGARQQALKIKRENDACNRQA